MDIFHHSKRSQYLKLFFTVLTFFSFPLKLPSTRRIVHTHTHSLSLSLSLSSQYILLLSLLYCVRASVCVCVCFCVCEREREREKELPIVPLSQMIAAKKHTPRIKERKKEKKRIMICVLS